jgi:hypothetical protein
MSFLPKKNGNINSGLSNHFSLAQKSTNYCFFVRHKIFDQGKYTGQFCNIIKAKTKKYDALIGLIYHHI